MIKVSSSFLGALGFSLALCGAAGAAPPAPAAPVYEPPKADQVTHYSPTLLPCTILKEEEMVGLVRRKGDKEVAVPLVNCKGAVLAGKSLRELSILRNTVYARYGWDGFRKAWLREHFHSQPWFRPNPRFSYKLLSDVDRKNVHIIGTYEQSLSERTLVQMENDVYARRGKIFGDKPTWRLKGGKIVKRCDSPGEGAEMESGPDGDDEALDCRYAALPWYKPNPKYSEALLTAEDRIELGLISRARGEFATDTGKREDKEKGLEKLLALKDLRELSLRDLRILRNTIYARRGRPFKSKILQQHFAQMSWYKIDPAYTDNLLSAMDKRNVGLIKSVENELGGPLSDEDFLIEPAVDLA